MLNTSRRHSASCQPSALSRAGGARPQSPDSWASRCSGHPACSWPKGTECGLHPHGRAPQKKHPLFPDRFTVSTRTAGTVIPAFVASAKAAASQPTVLYSSSRRGNLARQDFRPYRAPRPSAALRRGRSVAQTAAADPRQYPYPRRHAPLPKEAWKFDHRRYAFGAPGSCRRNGPPSCAAKRSAPCRASSSTINR
jgi:hypothetical protein